MRLYISLVLLIGCLTASNVAQGSVEGCECYRPWNCCWLCGYAQDWYLSEEVLDTPIALSNPPLLGNDCATCFETCGAAKALIVLNHLIYRTIVEEKCYINDADLKKAGISVKNTSCFDVMKAFTRAENGRPLEYYGDYIKRVDLFSKLALTTIEKVIYSNLEDAERGRKQLAANRKEMSKEEIIKTEDYIKYRRSVAAKYEESHSNVTKLSQEAKARINSLFGTLHAYCDHLHSNINTRYNIGLFYLLQGQSDEFVWNAKHLYETSTEEEINSLEPILSLHLAEAYIDSNRYEEALPVLSDLLAHTPSKEGHFLRALANFQCGYFDASAEDFKASGYNVEGLESGTLRFDDYIAFGEGFNRGLTAGQSEGLKTFKPLLFRDPYGLGHGLFSFNSTIHVNKRLKDAIDLYIGYLGSLSYRELSASCLELQDCVSTWKALSQSERGEKIGFCIGKYGIDFLGCKDRFKLNALYKDVRRALYIQTLSVLVSSHQAKESLLIGATGYHSRREELLDRSYNIDRNSQIPYTRWTPALKERKRDIRETVILTNPNIAALLNRFAGKGCAAGEPFPGVDAFHEIVDFGEAIGLWMAPSDETRFITTRGAIYYNRDGSAYIVPLRPLQIPPFAPKNLVNE